MSLYCLNNLFAEVKTFQFSPAEWQNIHRKIFEGVFSHARKIRDYNITKKEWVLKGNTVMVRANYNDLQNGIHATTKFLELFFENLLMNAGHDLKNRYMHVDYENESAVQSANVSDSKCNNCTLEELAIINELIKNPNITQKELAVVIGKSERTIKTRTVEMQEKGLICRENGKRNGRWKVLVER